MKLSNLRILNDSKKLEDISKRKFPVKVSYAISRNISKINSNLKIYDKERQKLIEEYSIKDKDGKTKINKDNQINLQLDRLDEWNRDNNELCNIEFEIDIYKFSIDALEGYDMAPEELMLLDYMIEG